MRDWTAEVRTRLSLVRLSPAREAEIVEELSQHLEDRWRELVAGGEDPDVAARLALAEFRGTDVLARYLAPLRQARWADPFPSVARRWFLLEGLTADLRNAIRALRATPGFTIVALVVLTLGVGATTAIFSVVDAVVLRALPFDERDRLVAVGERRSLGPKDVSGDPHALLSIAAPNYMDWAAQQQVFESMAAVTSFGGGFTLSEPGAEPEDLRGQRVTAGFFDVLRMRPALGRAFTAEHEIDGRHRVAILSDALWRRRFGGNPQIVGRTISLDVGNYDVLGIMPPGVTYPVGAVRSTDLWVPYVVPPRERIRDPRGRASVLQSIARLKPGVSIEQAQAQLDQIAAALEEANPVWNKDNKVGVRPLRDHLVGASTKSWMLMLLGAVAIVLLIACANVANLLLARASTREREVAVRAALGAGRWRLIRGLMVESLVLSVAGTVLATAMAWWAIQVLKSSIPEGVPRVMAIALDLRVLATAAGLSIVTGLLFGTVPALQLSKPDLTTALKDGTRGASAGRASQRMRSTLVVAEVALAVVLLVGAALFIGSFITLMRIDLGFSPERVLTVQITPRGEIGKRAPDATPSFIEIVERIGQTPGVMHASMIVGGLPLTAASMGSDLKVPGKETSGDNRVNIRLVTPDYHNALRIPLLSGRLFDAADRPGGTNVVIINESAARNHFAGENPLGRSVTINNGERTIVGVVGDMHQSSLETDPNAEAYLPMAQVPTNFGGELVIRTSGDPYTVLPAVKSAVRAAMPDVPLRNVRTMEELLARQTAQRRLTMLLLGLFGLLGLVISAVGIYGVMAYAVSQQTKEIGIRMALGATRSDVVGRVLINAGVLVALGLIIGGIGAWYLSATAKAFLFRLEPNDPRAFVTALLSLSLAALVASALPARRAASVDPIVALRAE
jgi:putative ABC transport system permease protein